MAPFLGLQQSAGLERQMLHVFFVAEDMKEPRIVKALELCQRLKRLRQVQMWVAGVTVELYMFLISYAVVKDV